MRQGELRVIALYLPQFHSIPENDRWWGEGFTDWKNVRKAEPRFREHYQPHIPLGHVYYDLKESITRISQARLASEHGIYGFCYYHYWFNGRRLLEFPFNEILKNKNPQFPFCICWANENWTRRWDGRNSEILIAQHYSEEDSRQFICDLIPAFLDERYIRINGKPLVLVYRTGLLPTPKQTTEIWRDAMIKAGVGEIYLVRVENFLDGLEPRPEDLGFDAAMEFAPYWGLLGRKAQGIKSIDQGVSDISADLSIFDYDECAKCMLERPTPPYKLFRGVFPHWDNSPRRKHNPTIFINSTPAKYAYWLSLIAKQTIETQRGEERIVFINAWNEWGEGCHLEPDEKNGLEYLNATKLVLKQANDFQIFLDQLNNANEYSDADVNQWFENLRKVYDERNGLDARDILLLEIFGNYIMPSKKLVSDTEMNQRFYRLLYQKDEIISSIYNSKSWKITAPLRMLYDKFFN
jgi:hypothetical protein